MHITTVEECRFRSYLMEPHIHVPLPLRVCQISFTHLKRLKYQNICNTNIIGVVTSRTHNEEHLDFCCVQECSRQGQTIRHKTIILLFRITNRTYGIDKLTRQPHRLFT